MLRYRADVRTLAFVAGYYTLLVGFWLADPSDWRIGLAGVLTLCVVSWITAVITHNTIHHPIFKSRTMNKAFQVVLTLCYGHPVSAYVPGHNLSHHRYTQEPRDVMRTHKVRYRWNLLNGLLFLPHVAGDITKGDIVFFKAMRKRRPRWARQFLIELAIFALVTITLLALSPRRFLLYFFLPHFYAAWGIITINYLQHDGCDEDDPYNHSRNFVGRVFNWFTFNNGYHGIHHMKPSLHWSLAADVHERELKPHIHPNLDQPSMLIYIWRTFIWPGRRVTFEGDPVLLPAVVEDESWLGSSVPDDALGAEG